MSYPLLQPKYTGLTSGSFPAYGETRYGAGDLTGFVAGSHDIDVLTVGLRVNPDIKLTFNTREVFYFDATYEDGVVIPGIIAYRFSEGGVHKWWCGKCINRSESSQGSALNLVDISSLVSEGVTDGLILRAVWNRTQDNKLYLMANGVFIDEITSPTATIAGKTVRFTFSDANGVPTTGQAAFIITSLKYEYLDSVSSGLPLPITADETLTLLDGTPTFATDAVNVPRVSLLDMGKFQTSKLQSRRPE